MEEFYVTLACFVVVIIVLAFTKHKHTPEEMVDDLTAYNTITDDDIDEDNDIEKDVQDNSSDSNYDNDTDSSDDD